VHDTSWSDGLSLDDAGRGLVGHAGAVLLRKAADVTGLTEQLSKALTVAEAAPGWDRGVVVADLAVAIGVGAKSMSDIAVLSHQAAVFGAVPSDSTVRRTLALAKPKVLKRIARARAAARRRVWQALIDRDGDIPWLVVAGKELTGVVVIDVDATLITAHSAKTGAASTYKKGFGFHPLLVECDNTQENLTVLLRPGNAGSNTVCDHVTVLAAAVEQIPPSHRGKLLFRADGAGATHGLLEYFHGLNTRRRKVEYSVGWAIDEAIETAIAAVPAADWQASLLQDGDPVDPDQTAGVAEITGLLDPAVLQGWPEGLRLIARRTRISRWHHKKLTAFERATGWHYAVFATATTGPGIHAQWLDARHRAHAHVEDRMKDHKMVGMRNLPSKDWDVNTGWIHTAAIACDLLAWIRLLGLHDDPELCDADPDTLRYRILHIPARLAVHARRRILHLAGDWPWTPAILTCWKRLCLAFQPG
jgi:hypothetical protein